VNRLRHVSRPRGVYVQPPNGFDPSLLQGRHQICNPIDLFRLAPGGANVPMPHSPDLYLPNVGHETALPTLVSVDHAWIQQLESVIW
jgi:hypothetical protein